MLFTDVRFALLVAACWLSFAAAPVRHRAHVLAAAGAVFYLLYARSDAPLVIALILIAYAATPRFTTWVATLVLAVLAFFKLRGGVSLVPLGLSFLAFELVHFCIERRRGRLGDVRFAEYLGYTLYFPCRVAGPIRRFPDFRTSMTAAAPTIGNVYAGFVRVLIGLAKKFALADVLGLTVAELPFAVAPAHIAKIVLAYSLQIYFDFSAYSDLAIGISRMFGIAVPENFRWPYLSGNIQEFWTRWHISLSTWIRDYAFLPLGRALFATRLRSAPSAVAAVSYLGAFIAVGAWHGLTPNYLLWGAYHGVLLGGHHVFRKTVAERFAMHPLYRSAVVKGLSIAVTFAFVTVGWILFLTPTPAEATRLIRLMAGRS